MNFLEVLRLLEKKIPMDRSNRAHWLSYHTHMRSRTGMIHPFIKVLCQILTNINQTYPGYATIMAERISSYKGTQIDQFEQLLQLFAEVLVLNRALEVSDIIEGNKYLLSEPREREGVKNPEFRTIINGIPCAGEVKAPSLLEFQKDRPSSFQYTTRWPFTIDAKDQGTKTLLPLDNRIKDFLKSSQNKFKEYVKNNAFVNDFRLLFIVWDDFIYEPITALLHSASGLFTPNSFYVDKNGEPVKFPLVDGVIIIRHLQQFVLALQDRTLVHGLSHPFQLINPRTPCAFIQNPFGRSVPQVLLNTFNAVDPRSLPASEYQITDWVDWTTGISYTGLDQIPQELYPKIFETIRRATNREKRQLLEEKGKRLSIERGIPYRNLIKVGRNDPCPCGSGKKYKRCCL
ncbi:YecA family protein [Effusibacillus lacus]|uniref:Preprotein translocase subunit SecA n=1 Tax=Effusibacillus lacus TaxID=1348429 RepID=A0A292YFP7_9BACL|nr:SEC-C metal-binding domain-containing protein [Effusibacillus lacus]TCS75492.1 SEC-C motif-containing protein [Effusibacillus lacus]GAX88957.1 hypothetical protein EFBL_0571 [Effusibacillus lacus]